MTDKLELECRLWGARKLRMTIYMISKIGHIKIFFPGTEVKDILGFIREMESQGYQRCSWFQWLIKKWLFSFRCMNKIKVIGRKELVIDIGEDHAT